MKVKDLSTKRIKLVKSVMRDGVGNNLAQDSDTTQFEVGRFLVEESGDNASVTLIIPLKRIYRYHTATTFFPTASLLTISCLTLFIDPERFEAKIGLSLTTMLVMQTLQENIGDNLPKTAYIKLIDEWLIFGMCVPFAVFLVLVFIEILPADHVTKVSDHTNLVRNAARKEFTKERLNRFFQVVIPVMTVLTVLVYVIRVTYKTYSQRQLYFS